MARKLGRPSPYDAAFCAQLVAHMGGGLSFESFAGKVGVSVNTLYEWAKRHKPFREAKGEGNAKSLLWWEQLGQAAILGIKVPLGGGREVDGRKVNAAMWVYTMKCRFRAHGWNENDDGQAADPGSKKREFALNYQKKGKAS